MRRFPIDKTINKIFNETEDHFKDKGVTRDQIKDVFYLLFRNSKEVMKSIDFPEVILPKFGRFRPKIGAVKKLKRKFKDEDTVYRKLWKTVLRIKSEKQKRKRK